MLKALGFLCVLGVSAITSGCTSYVKTFDGSGTLLGECRSSKAWLIFGGGGATCGGSANPKEQK